MTRITTSAIRAAEPGAVLKDDLVRGLQLRAFPTKKSFYLYYRTKSGRQRKPKIGDFGSISLTKAREIATDWLGQVAAGGDPSKDRQNLRSAPTVADLRDRYMAEHATRKKPYSRYEDARIWDSIVIPEIGSRKVVEVDFDDIAKIHGDREDRPYMANRAVALLSKAFSLAEKWKMRPDHSNPCRFIDRYPERKRKRYPQPDEITALWGAFGKVGKEYPREVALFKLLLFTGARLSEWMHGEWDWVDGDYYRLPDSKTGAKDIYLPSQARAVLAEMLDIKTNDYIFPGRYGDKPMVNPYTAWDEVRDAAGIADLRLHDLRHSFASIGLSHEDATDGDLERIGQLLGHRSVDTTRGYAHLLDSARKRVGDQAADRIAEWATKKAG